MDITFVFYTVHKIVVLIFLNPRFKKYGFLSEDKFETRIYFLPRKLQNLNTDIPNYYMNEANLNTSLVQLS